MKTILTVLTLVLAICIPGKGQTKTEPTPTPPVWSEADRKFLLDNLTRSKQEIIDETQNLTKEQWNFIESPDRWSINQIVEHIALWELLLMREVSQALAMPPDPKYTYYHPDSIFFSKDPNTLKDKNALDATKPFSFAIPLGNNEGKNNVTWLTTMRNESIECVRKETRNIRIQYNYCAGSNVHQTYLIIIRHTDRHLRQLRKVKAHADYPK